MQAMSPIQGKHPQRIRGWHVDIRRVEGPTGRQTASNSGGHQGPTLEPTGQPPRESIGWGGPKGVGWTHMSAEPTLCWLILAFHIVLPGWPLIHSQGANSILPKLPKAYK
jgi:hypothetical protein